MIHIECVQNSEKWYQERLGKPTSSEFDRILTRSGTLSSQRFDYMYQLIYERIFEKRAETIKPTYWMARGAFLEETAALACENYLNQKLHKVGILTTDDGRIRSSPDRIVDWKHAVEIKCPKPWKHMEYSVLGPQNDYYMQLYGIMWVGGFERVSFFSYCPGMPCRPLVIHRNQKIMNLLDKIMPLFADELDKHEKAVRDMGEYYDIPVTMGQATFWEQEAN